MEISDLKTGRKMRGSYYDLVRQYLPDGLNASSVSLISSLVLTGLLLRAFGKRPNYLELMDSYDRKAGARMGTCRKGIRNALSCGHPELTVSVQEYLFRIESAIWEAINFED